MVPQNRERVLAARVPESCAAGLDQLVDRSFFENRSSAVRESNYNLLVATRALQELVSEGCVDNSTPSLHPCVILRARQQNASDSHRVTEEGVPPA
jgi:Arc/MetJ-type ribon-helix-helix transcriptional regulator